MLPSVTNQVSVATLARTSGSQSNSTSRPRRTVKTQDLYICEDSKTITAKEKLSNEKGKKHPLIPIRREYSVTEKRPQQLLPLLSQTITPKIVRQDTFQILRLNRRNKRPRQNLDLTGMDTQLIKSSLGRLERSMLFDVPVARHEEVDTQDWILVAPFGNGLAAFGGDEASAGCADCNVTEYVIGNQEANRASEGVIEGQGQEQQHDERDTRQSSRREEELGLFRRERYTYFLFSRPSIMC